MGIRAGLDQIGKERLIKFLTVRQGAGFELAMLGIGPLNYEQSPETTIRYAHSHIEDKVTQVVIANADTRLYANRDIGGMM